MLEEEEGDAPSIPIFSYEVSFYLIDSEFELYLHPTATLFGKKFLHTMT